jgi:hypothetical protein
MKLAPQDWLKLRKSLVGLGLALILVTLLVGAASQKQDDAQAAMDKQQSQLNQARQRYQTSGLEKETIVKYLPVYQRLIQEGFVGEERRIEWVDALRSIHQQHKLFGINYSIGAQEQYQPAFALNLGSFGLYRSTMKLELSMLHEGDLLTLLEALSEKQTTPFMLRQCEIKRVSKVDPDKLAPYFLATCELDWLTLREPPKTGGL